MTAEGVFSKRPSNDDIIEVFFSRSAFFRYHAKLFPLVVKVPVVQKWLLGEEGVTDFEVWNFRKPTFENLKVVLDEHGAAKLPEAAESSKNVKSKGGEIEVKVKAKSEDEKKDGKKGKKKAKENDEGSEDGERSRRKGKQKVTENDGESEHGEKGGRKGKKKAAAKSKTRFTV